MAKAKKMNALFVYGTLQFPEVQEALLGRSLKMFPATLAGYRPVHIKYATGQTEYPVLQSDLRAETAGQVLWNVNPQELLLLHFYEGNAYELLPVLVAVNGERLAARAYLARDPENLAYGEPWQMETFKQLHLQRYMEQEIPELLLAYQKQQQTIG